MSLKAIKEAARLLGEYIETSGPCDHAVNICGCGDMRTLTAMRDEIGALEKAAKDLTRLCLSDGVDDVAHREHVIAAMTDDPSSQWNHPDVRAWSDAATLLASIAKESE